MPEEGGITGMGSIAIPWVVENVGQAHAFIEAMIQPETAGLVSAGTGTDSRAEGAVANTGEVYGDRFAEAHTAENPAEPWHCQAGTPYFAPVRLERADRIADAT